MLSSVSASTPVVVSDSDDDDDDDSEALCSAGVHAVDGAIEAASGVDIEGDESFFTVVGSVRVFFALARSFLSAFYKKRLREIVYETAKI